MRVVRWLAVLVMLLVILTIIALAVGPQLVERSMNRVEGHTLYPITMEVQRLHASLTIGDMHADSTLWQRDLLKRSSFGHVDIPRLQQGNVALQVFTSVTRSPRNQNYYSNKHDAADNITLLSIFQRWPRATIKSLTARALFQSQRLHKWAARAPDQLMLVKTRADLERLLSQRAQGKVIVGGVLGIEGSHALDGKLDNIDTLYNAGFRVMSLQHFFDNRLGGSLHGVSGAGLTEFGRQAVTAMVAKGIVLDVAHSSPQVVEEVLALVNKPLIVSHTGFSGHCNSPRNISDQLMQDIAAAGGLIGVGYWAGAICATDPAQVVAAIRYGIDLVGAEHIALGSDFDGAVTTSFDASELAVLTQQMVDSGFSDREIRLVMGENLVRLLRQQLPLK